MYRYSKSMARLPDFRVIGPSENRLESDMTDSPDFYSSEIRSDRFTEFCVPDFREIGSKKPTFLSRFPENRAV